MLTADISVQRQLSVELWDLRQLVSSSSQSLKSTSGILTPNLYSIIIHDSSCLLLPPGSFFCLSAFSSAYLPSLSHALTCNASDPPPLPESRTKSFSGPLMLRNYQFTSRTSLSIMSVQTFVCIHPNVSMPQSTPLSGTMDPPLNEFCSGAAVPVPARCESEPSIHALDVLWADLRLGLGCKSKASRCLTNMTSTAFSLLLVYSTKFSLSKSFILLSELCSDCQWSRLWHQFTLKYPEPWNKWGRFWPDFSFLCFLFI